MMNKKSPAQNCNPGSSKHFKPNDNTLHAQRARILDWLLGGESLTTLQARNMLNVMHPAGRVRELRMMGWSIKTSWAVVCTLKSRHRVAKYFLSVGGEK